MLEIYKRWTSILKSNTASHFIFWKPKLVAILRQVDLEQVYAESWREQAFQIKIPTDENFETLDLVFYT